MGGSPAEHSNKAVEEARDNIALGFGAPPSRGLGSQRERVCEESHVVVIGGLWVWLELNLKRGEMVFLWLRGKLFGVC